MSLDWNINDVENWELKTNSQKGRDLRDCLIWADLSVQMGGVPKGQVEEVHRRHQVLHRCGISAIYENGKYRPPTMEELRSFEGLRTNVSKLSETQFRKYVINRVFNEVDEDILVKRRLAS
jgi:hypothetical protein